MEFTTKKWHVRLYLWSLDVLDAFDPPRNSWSRRSREKSNLCPYVRTILIYMPFALITQLWMWACILFTAVALPVYLMGSINYLITVGAISGLIAVVAFGKHVAKKLEQKAASSSSEAREGTYRQLSEVPRKDTTPGFFDLITLYWKAVHEKICPEIRIVAEGSN